MLHLTKQPEGQGVASATKEQINLLKEMAKDEFIIKENQMRDGDINHFHQIDPKMYIRKKKSKEQINLRLLAFVVHKQRAVFSYVYQQTA